MNPGLLAIKKRSVAASYASVVLGDGPYGFWPLISDTNDISGNGFNGVVQGGSATFGLPKACPQGAAAFQNDGSKYISLASMPLSTAPYPHTIECWFTVPSSVGANSVGIMGLQNQATGVGSNYNPSLYINTSGLLVSGYYSNGRVTIATPNSVADGNPHHAVAVETGSTMYLYLDGVLIGSATATPNAFNNTAYLLLSCANDGSWPGANTSGVLDNQIGSIAYAAYYNKALTATQITNHYNAGK